MRGIRENDTALRGASFAIGARTSRAAVAKALRDRLFPEVGAGGFTRADTTVEFYLRVNALLDRDMTVLDFGAGRGSLGEEALAFRRRLRTLQGKVRRVIGVDVDPVVIANPHLDEAHLLHLSADGSFRLPQADGEIDVVVSDWTFEHLEKPAVAAIELARVVRPGGWLCARTTARWGYIALGNRLLPERLHGAILRRLQPGRQERDVFPTHYRLNTLGALKRAFPESAWSHHSYMTTAEPTYAGGSVALARLLMTDRFLPAGLRPVLLCFLRKR